MMLRKLPLLLAFLMLFMTYSTVAQLDLGFQVRPRAEFRNGFKTLTLDDRNAAFFIEQRSRFYAQYTADKFQMKINLQDVRIWGSTSQIYKTDFNTLTNVYEAWGLYQFNDNSAFKVGRMELNYDNARFLGNLDWAAQGRSHDALLLTFKNADKDLKLDIGASFNQVGFEPAKLFETLYTGVNNYKTAQFAWLNKKLSDGKISLLVHNDGRQVAADSSVAMRQTYGLIGSTSVSDLKVGGELYYQGGKNGADRDVSAMLIAAYVTMKTNSAPITMGVDYLSGTSINDTKDKSFSPLYGTNHKFYGYMDYFYVGNAHGQQGNIAGLLDLHLKTKLKTGDKSALAINAHYFNSAADLYNPLDLNQTESKYLGTEIDLVYNLKLDENVKLNIGYSQMFAGESMELVKATPGDHEVLNNWIWFMIDFKPQPLKIISQ